MDLLKHFILFYFLLNSIIVFIALKYDTPKGVIEQLGWWKLIKAILKLFFGGMVFLILRAIDEF